MSLLNEDMCSIRSFRAEMRQRVEQIKETGRPLIVLNHSEPDMVVISHDMYNEWMLDRIASKPEALAKIRERLEHSLKRAAEGHVQDALEALDEIENE